MLQLTAETRVWGSPPLEEECVGPRAQVTAWYVGEVSVSDWELASGKTFDVYGARTTSGTGPDIAFGFTGREHDASGFIYSRDRYLDPATGRWLQPDRGGFIDGVNLYQYARGAPVRLTDPTGLGTFDSLTMKMFAALASGNLPLAMYYFSAATGVDLETQVVFANALKALADGLGGGNNIQFPGNCGNVARSSIQPLMKLSEELGVGRPMFLKIVSTDGALIGFEVGGVTKQVSTNGVHVAVKFGDLIFDAFTGPGGMTVTEYELKLFTKTGQHFLTKEYASYPSLIPVLE